MNLMSNVNGEDLRHIICANGLMDHCNDLPEILGYEDDSSNSQESQDSQGSQDP